MRLIDADAFKEALKSNCKPELCHDCGSNWCEYCCPKNDFIDLIDDAPEVEINTNDIEYKAYCKGLEDGKKISRPQGEWLHNSDRPDNLICSACNCGWDMWRYESKELKYCPNCGAEMQKGEENETN